MHWCECHYAFFRWRTWIKLELLAHGNQPKPEGFAFGVGWWLSALCRESKEFCYITLLHVLLQYRETSYYFHIWYKTANIEFFFWWSVAKKAWKCEWSVIILKSFTLKCMYTPQTWTLTSFIMSSLSLSPSSPASITIIMIFYLP
jgi:hypothetical protein